MQSKRISSRGIAHPALLVSLAVVVSVVGFAGYRVVGTNQGNLNRAEEKAGVITLTPASLEGIVPLDQARQMAVENSEAEVVDLELGSEDGLLVYKVDLSDGSRVLLNAKSGAVIKAIAAGQVPAETDDEEDAPLPANFAVGIELGRAHEIAQQKFPEGKIQKIGLDVENGVVVYSIRFADKARVDVDAKTGVVVRTKQPRAEEKSKKDSTLRSESSSNSSRSGSGSSGSSKPSDSDSNDDADDSSSSGSSSSSSSGSGSSSSNSGSSNTELRVEGILTLSNGTPTVTQNGTTYTIKTTQDVSDWVGKKVRAEGALQSGNVITAEKVELRD